MQIQEGNNTGAALDFVSVGASELLGTRLKANPLWEDEGRNLATEAGVVETIDKLNDKTQEHIEEQTKEVKTETPDTSNGE